MRGLTPTSVGLKIIAIMQNGEEKVFPAVFVPPMYARPQLPSGWYVPHVPSAFLVFHIVNEDHVLAQSISGQFLTVKESILAVLFVDGAAMTGDLTTIVPPELHVVCGTAMHTPRIVESMKPMTAHVIVEKASGHVEERTFWETIVLAVYE